MAKEKPEILYGFHSVHEALAAGRRVFHRLFVVAGRKDQRVASALEAARSRNIPVEQVPAARMQALTASSRHQGVALEAGILPVGTRQTLCERIAQGNAMPTVLLLDNLADPHNLGAIVRTALCAGVVDVVIPKDRSAGPTPIVSKVSAGAMEHIQLYRVTNMVRTIGVLKDNGLWVAGLDGSAESSIYTCDLSRTGALVLGAEEKGIRPLVKRHCDMLVRIPQRRFSSLNVSAAAAVVLFEQDRQKRAITG